MGGCNAKKAHTNKARLCTLSIPTQVLEVLTRAVGQLKESKRTQIREEEIIVSSFTGAILQMTPKFPPGLHFNIAVLH